MESKLNDSDKEVRHMFMMDTNANTTHQVKKQQVAKPPSLFEMKTFKIFDKFDYDDLLQFQSWLDIMQKVELTDD